MNSESSEANVQLNVHSRKYNFSCSVIANIHATYFFITYIIVAYKVAKNINIKIWEHFRQCLNENIVFDAVTPSLYTTTIETVGQTGLI